MSTDRVRFKGGTARITRSYFKDIDGTLYEKNLETGEWRTLLPDEARAVESRLFFKEPPS